MFTRYTFQESVSRSLRYEIQCYTIKRVHYRMLRLSHYKTFKMQCLSHDYKNGVWRLDYRNSTLEVTGRTGTLRTTCCGVCVVCVCVCGWWLLRAALPWRESDWLDSGGWVGLHPGVRPSTQDEPAITTTTTTTSTQSTHVCSIIVGSLNQKASLSLVCFYCS